jgi:hypothetical protein
MTPVLEGTVRLDHGSLEVTCKRLGSEKGKCQSPAKLCHPTGIAKGNLRLRFLKNIYFLIFLGPHR